MTFLSYSYLQEYNNAYTQHSVLYYKKTKNFHIIELACSMHVIFKITDKGEILLYHITFTSQFTNEKCNIYNEI